MSQGDTRDEAMRNVREAAELYPEDGVESGQPIPKEAETAHVEVAVLA